MAQLAVSTCTFNSSLFSSSPIPTYTFRPSASWGQRLVIQGNFFDSAGSPCSVSAQSVKPYLVDSSLNNWSCDLTGTADGPSTVSCPSVKYGQYTLYFGEHEGYSLAPRDFIITASTATEDTQAQVTRAPAYEELRRRAALTSSTDDSCDAPTTTSSSAAATPTTTNPSCPGTNGQIYVSEGGLTWNVTCYQDYQSGQIAVAQTTNFAGCIEACAKATGCVAASYTGGSSAGFCYLKNQEKSFVTANNVWAVVLTPQPALKARGKQYVRNVHQPRQPWGKQGAILY